MIKYLTIAIMSLAILAGSHQISRVERDGSWVYLYNESGEKYQTLSANSVGDVIGVAAIHSPPAMATGSILGTKTARDSTPVPPDNR